MCKNKAKLIQETKQTKISPVVLLRDTDFYIGHQVVTNTITKMLYCKNKNNNICKITHFYLLILS